MGLITRQCELIAADAYVLGFDGTHRPDSATTIGSADVGGAWTARQGTFAWGITNGLGYNTKNGGGASDVITQTYTKTPRVMGFTFATDTINTHILTPVPLLVDSNNFMSIGLINGAVAISCKVTGSAVSRVTVAQGSTGLPATGASVGSISTIYNVTSGNVQVLLNGVGIAGATYTLSPTEFTAFGSGLQAGVLNSWISGTGTASTFTNYFATT